MIATLVNRKAKAAKPVLLACAGGNPIVELGVVENARPEYETELGFARGFVRRNLDDIRYSKALKTWYIWEEVGGYWRIDKQNEIMARGQENITAMYHKACELTGADRNKAMNEARAFETRKHFVAAMAFVLDDPRIQLDYHSLDADPLLFGVQNGVTCDRGSSATAGARI
jgi:hypothetical protein